MVFSRLRGPKVCAVGPLSLGFVLPIAIEEGLTSKLENDLSDFDNEIGQYFNVNSYGPP